MAGCGFVRALMAHRHLRFLEIVTHSVECLDIARSAWVNWLGYRVVAEGELGAELCAAWDTPASAGRPWCLLQPASGAEVYIRFVETAIRNSFSPASYGWCATELLVTDPDRLLADLATSPFPHIAGPMDLFAQPRAPRALQMVGPSGELIYFTRILPGGSRYGMKGATSPVDRPFIVPVSGPSMTAMHAFYGDVLGLRTMPSVPFINSIMARACDVDERTPFSLSVVPIPGRRFLIELDELPPGLPRRHRPQGELPGGMAMVSFVVERIDAVPVAWRADPRPVTEALYAGRRTGVTEGPAGEWLELIEGF